MAFTAKNNQEEIRNLNRQDLIEYIEAFLQEHPVNQIKTLFNKFKAGNKELRQPLLSSLVVYHNEKKLYTPSSNAASTSSIADTTKGQFLDATTIEILRDTYVNHILETAVEEYGDEVTFALAVAIRDRHLGHKLRKDGGFVSQYLEVLSGDKFSESNKNIRLSIIRLIDVYTSTYGIEILGYGMFSTINFNDQAKEIGRAHV